SARGLGPRVVGGSGPSIGELGARSRIGAGPSFGTHVDATAVDFADSARGVGEDVLHRQHAEATVRRDAVLHVLHEEGVERRVAVVGEVREAAPSHARVNAFARSVAEDGAVVPVVEGPLFDLALSADANALDTANEGSPLAP